MVKHMQVETSDDGFVVLVVHEGDTLGEAQRRPPSFVLRLTTSAATFLAEQLADRTAALHALAEAEHEARNSGAAASISYVLTS